MLRLYWGWEIGRNNMTECGSVNVRTPIELVSMLALVAIIYETIDATLSQGWPVGDVILTKGYKVFDVTILDNYIEVG